eukprot:g6807.t1
MKKADEPTDPEADPYNLVPLRAELRRVVAAHDEQRRAVDGVEAELAAVQAALAANKQAFAAAHEEEDFMSAAELKKAALPIKQQISALEGRRNRLAPHVRSAEIALKAARDELRQAEDSARRDAEARERERLRLEAEARERERLRLEAEARERAAAARRALEPTSLRVVTELVRHTNVSEVARGWQHVRRELGTERAHQEGLRREAEALRGAACERRAEERAREHAATDAALLAAARKDEAARSRRERRLARAKARAAQEAEDDHAKLAAQAAGANAASTVAALGFGTDAEPEPEREPEQAARAGSRPGSSQARARGSSRGSSRGSGGGGGLSRPVSRAGAASSGGSGADDSTDGGHRPRSRGKHKKRRHKKGRKHANKSDEAKAKARAEAEAEAEKARAEAEAEAARPSAFELLVASQARDEAARAAESGAFCVGACVDANRALTGLVLDGERLCAEGGAGRQLRGRLPFCIGALSTSLQELRLPRNRLGGALPRSLGLLKVLRVLDLQDNCFGAELPPALGALDALQELNLAGNAFCGAVPCELGRLRALQTLDLQRNRLAGTLPPALFVGLRSLQRLCLNDNRLEGSLPDSMGAMRALRVAWLHRNRLAGRVPVCLWSGALGHLEQLWLHENDLDAAAVEQVRTELKKSRSSGAVVLAAQMDDTMPLTELLGIRVPRRRVGYAAAAAAKAEEAEEAEGVAQQQAERKKKEQTRGVGGNNLDGAAEAEAQADAKAKRAVQDLMAIGAARMWEAAKETKMLEGCRRAGEQSEETPARREEQAGADNAAAAAEATERAAMAAEEHATRARMAREVVTAAVEEEQMEEALVVAATAAAKKRKADDAAAEAAALRVALGVDRKRAGGVDEGAFPSAPTQGKLFTEFEASFRQGPLGFGFVIVPNGAVRIARVHGQALEHMRPGDYVLAVAGAPVHGLTDAAFLRLIRAAGRPFALHLARRVAGASEGTGGGTGARRGSQKALTAHVQFDETGKLGFGFSVASDGSIVLERTTGQARQLGLRPGDRVLAIGGESVTGLDKAGFLALLKTRIRPFRMTYFRYEGDTACDDGAAAGGGAAGTWASPVVSPSLSPSPSRSPSPLPALAPLSMAPAAGSTTEQAFRITFEDGTLGFGFSVASDGSIVLERTTGQARQLGLRPGDRVLAIGGESVAGLDKAGFVARLKASDGYARA